MLKVYGVQSIFRLNNQGEWKIYGDGDYIVKDDNKFQKEIIIFDNFSWKQTIDILNTTHIDGIHSGETLFRKRPFIHVFNRWDDFELKLFENQVETISCKNVYTEKNVTLNWIINHLSTDETIQYIKERGMSVCPIIK